MTRMISLAVLIGILVAVGTIFFRVMSGFLVPLFLSALLAVLFQPLYVRIEKALGGKSRYLAAGVTTLVVSFIVLAPAVLIISVSVVEGLALVDEYRDVNVQQQLTKLKSQLALDIPLNDDLRKIQATLNYFDESARHGELPNSDREVLANLTERAKRLVKDDQDNRNEVDAERTSEFLRSIDALEKQKLGTLEFDDELSAAKIAFRRFKLAYLGGPYRAWLKELVNPDEKQIEALRTTWLSSKSPILSFGDDTVSFVGRTLFGAVIMIGGLFFLYADGPYLLDSVIGFSPLEERYVRELIGEFDRATRAIVTATLLSAVAQGLLAGFGYQFTGVGSVFLLTLLSAVFAMVPFLGAAAVWITVCVYLYFVKNSPGSAIGLAVYGTLVVSMADNIIKPIVLHGQSNLHPLLALLSILGGVQTLGPIGILVGPMTVVFLQTLVKIVHREYRVFATHLNTETPPTDGPPPSAAEASEPEIAPAG